jgi:hypothetical protein
MLKKKDIVLLEGTVQRTDPCIITVRFSQTVGNQVSVPSRG